MVDRRIVRLKATQAEMERYIPPTGIGLTFLEWIPAKEEVIVLFVSSPLQPDPLYRKTGQDIRHELGTTWRNRVLEDNITSHPKSPRRALIIESLLDHPFLTGQAKSITRKDLLPAGIEMTPRELKKAAEEAIDVKEVEMTPEQAKEQLRLGSTGEPLDIQPKEVRQERRLEQIQKRGIEGEPEYREVYGPERNVYLTGVIDSG